MLIFHTDTPRLLKAAVHLLAPMQSPSELMNSQPGLDTLIFGLAQTG